MYDFALNGHIYEETTFGAVIYVMESGHWLFKNCLVLVQGDTSMPVGSIREIGIRQPFWKKLT